MMIFCLPRTKYSPHDKTEKIRFQTHKASGKVLENKREPSFRDNKYSFYCDVVQRVVLLLLTF